MIEVIVDFTSFKYLSICIYNLSILYINIIIARVFAKCFYFKILRIKNIITIRLVVKIKFILYSLVNKIR